MPRTNAFTGFLGACALSLGVVGGAHSAPEGEWKAMALYGDGVVNIRSLHGGQWVYQYPLQRSLATLQKIQETTHGASHSAAVVLGARTQADEAQFFSSQEERALWEMAEQMRQKEVSLAAWAAARARGHRIAQASTPKVIVTAKAVCVPHFEFASSKDWRDHLVCTETAR